MTEKPNDFWPSDLIDESVIPPVTILKRAASELSDRTRGLLLGDVRFMGKGDDETLFYSLQIVCPALDNFSYGILSMSHGIGLYPTSVTAAFLGDGEASNADELAALIRSVLQHDDVKRIVSSLIVQSKDGGRAL